MTRSQQLAEAFIHVATVNHYMVGIVEPFTVEEILDAEQIIIDQQNSDLQAGPVFDTLELALDLVEHAKRGLEVY